MVLVLRKTKQTNRQASKQANKIIIMIIIIIIIIIINKQITMNMTYHGLLMTYYGCDFRNGMVDNNRIVVRHRSSDYHGTQLDKN